MTTSPDHPRACGELAAITRPAPETDGSSPRMRGTLVRQPHAQPRIRIIPAHAGNSPWPPPTGHQGADHPRACGELSSSLKRPAVPRGSSPRMRGTQGSRSDRQPRGWIIPAHAGNSYRDGCGNLLPADHPRACGELPVLRPHRHAYPGSSPRMRGTLVAGHEFDVEVRIIPAHAGNSQVLASAPSSPPRIIPAHAGNSSTSAPRVSLSPDHPRACGELDCEIDKPQGPPGSSPRMRGTRLAGACEGFVNRIIPAHAGNSRSDPTACTSTPDHPRACGELPDTGEPEPSPSGSSPRMRGTRDDAVVPAQPDRIIPAHAGNSGSGSRLSGSTTDHPRACGEL